MQILIKVATITNIINGMMYLVLSKLMIKTLSMLLMRELVPMDRLKTYFQF